MIKLKIGAVLLTALSLSACATVTRGTREKFAIVSEPSGADVKMTNGLSCTTPCKIKMRRKDEFSATIAKPGYVSQTVAVKSRVHGGGGAALAGNVLIGGIIGGVVDSTNGSLRDLKPNPLSVKLVAVAAAPEQPAVVVAPAVAAAPAPTTPAPATTASAMPIAATVPVVSSGSPH